MNINYGLKDTFDESFQDGRKHILVKDYKLLAILLI